MTEGNIGSSGTIIRAPRTTMLRGRSGGVPVVALAPDPGAPPVGMLRHGPRPSPEPPAGQPHAHDFLALSYFERAGGWLTLDGDRSPIRAGDLLLVPPREVVSYDPSHDPDAEHAVDEPGFWGVFFQPEAFGAAGSGLRLSWQANPLLFPFVGGVAGTARRVSVPPGDRRAWVARLTALWEELHRSDDGHREAVRAHLTLLLVEVARLVGKLSGSAQARPDPLLTRVFAVIEDRYREGISLSDVARALHVTPGHLTTEVRRRTGRTVLDWITERRMTEARRLLAHSDRSVAEVGQRVGYADPAYFTRVFRRSLGVTPSAWRRASRG